MSRSDEFLELYRKLEEELSQRYEEAGQRPASVIKDFMYEDAAAPFRDDLNVCREVRNLLTHHALVGGEPAVEPSEALLESLRNVLHFLNEPRPALEIATPRKDMLFATPAHSARKIMAAMEKKGYSHVPVFGESRLIGVFSVSTIFSWLVEHPEEDPDPDAPVEAFSEYLALDRHTSERFEFVDRDADYWQVRSLFLRKPGRHEKRLAVVFITDDGRKDGRILGMITPWDLIGHEGGPEKDVV